jgi:hypothetical protein
MRTPIGPIEHTSTLIDARDWLWGRCYSDDYMTDQPDWTCLNLFCLIWYVPTPKQQVNPPNFSVKWLTVLSSIWDLLVSLEVNDKGTAIPVQTYCMPRGFQEVEAARFLDKWHRKVTRLSVHRSLPSRHQGYGAGRTDPATFSLVPQRLNQLRHRVPRQSIILCSILYNILDLLVLTFSSRLNSPSGSMLSHCWGFEITIWHNTLGRSPLDELLGHRRDLYPTTHKNNKRKASMCPAGFQSASQKAGGHRQTP